MAGAEAYLRAKLHLDPSNRFATIHQRYRQYRQTGQAVYTKVRFCKSLFMVALCNRETIYIFMLWFVLLLSFFLFFSSPNLSGRRLDVYHTLAHGVALVRI